LGRYFDVDQAVTLGWLDDWACTQVRLMIW